MRSKRCSQEISAGKGIIGYTGFLFGTGEEFWVILKQDSKNCELNFTRKPENTSIMSAPSMWLTNIQIKRMCQYVVPRTSED